jgi:hypothetical protein
VVNRIPRILSTLTLLALGSTAQAATLTVETDQTAWVYLNGRLLEYPPGETSLKAEKLEAGTYEVVVRNWLGKKVGESTLIMPKDGDAVLKWSSKALTVVSAPEQPKPKDDGSAARLAELLGEGAPAAPAEGAAATPAEGAAADGTATDAAGTPGMTLAPPAVTADGPKTLTTPAAAGTSTAATSAAPAATPATATPTTATPATATAAPAPAAAPASAAAIVSAAIATGKAADAPAAAAPAAATPAASPAAATGMTLAEPTPAASPTKVMVTTTPEAPAPVAEARKGSIEISGLEKDKARIWVDDQAVPYFEQTKSFVAVLLKEGEHTVKVAIGKKMAFAGKLEVRGDATNSCAVTAVGADWDTKCSWKTPALGPKQE